MFVIVIQFSEKKHLLAIEYYATCGYVAATQHSRASAMLDVCAKMCYSYKEVRV
ncbi:hypothetical protein ACE1CD_31695 [Aerosakkonema sp. BLCC-F183]|uniref:hypothetical protein n=1 Tax=Aerosakkonema sp. BLCC-F183 TaxID=3342834 RepID=UPI0035BB1CE6